MVAHRADADRLRRLLVRRVRSGLSGWEAMINDKVLAYMCITGWVVWFVAGLTAVACGLRWIGEWISNI